MKYDFRCVFSSGMLVVGLVAAAMLYQRPTSRAFSVVPFPHDVFSCVFPPPDKKKKEKVGC